MHTRESLNPGQGGAEGNTVGGPGVISSNHDCLEGQVNRKLRCAAVEGSTVTTAPQALTTRLSPRRSVFAQVR